MLHRKQSNSKRSTVLTGGYESKHLLSNKLSVDNDFIELFLRFFAPNSNSSLNILSAVELRLLFSAIEPFRDIGDVMDVARLSVLKLNMLPRNDVAVDPIEVRSPLRRKQRF